MNNRGRLRSQSLHLVQVVCHLRTHRASILPGYFDADPAGASGFRTPSPRLC